LLHIQQLWRQRCADFTWIGALVLLTGLLGCPGRAQEANIWRTLITPDNSLSFMMLKGNNRVFTTGVVSWGPNWGWVGVGSTQKSTGDTLELTTPIDIKGSIISLKQRVWKSGEQAISIAYELSADKDIPLTSIVATVSFEGAYQDGDVLFKHTDGTEGTVALALSGPGEQPETKSLVFRSKTAGDFTATLDPPTPIAYHNQMRILLARDLYKAGKKSVTITFNLNGPATLLAKQADLDALTKELPGFGWFPVTATNDVQPSVIGFENWLDKPAGVHGGVRSVNDHFEFADKTPIKFWGTNLSYGLSAPEKAQADYTAARFAKYGVNAVRMHKFTGAGWEGIGDEQDATKMTPAGLDRLDYFTAQLAKNGVYFGWSHTYHFRPKPGNRVRLLAYDEIQNKLGGDTYALINYAEDVQDLLIETVVNLLKHPNPYTGKTYAADPALCFVELQNEDDIFFYTTSGVYDACPTYRQDLLNRFAAWLTVKYGNQDGLAKAWGGALKPGETLDAKNIALQPNPWFMSESYLPNQNIEQKTRLLDNAAFFHDVQNKFYTRFVKAIRDAGYQGPICGSPWQAPSGLPHYYNLKSDYLAGFIDRHNYFGGGLLDSMLSKPGSGYLSTGLQQVIDRPFGISEWIHVYPSLYSAEGPALFAAYGMGLQGWDASYEFQSGQIDSAFTTNDVGHFPWGVWNTDVPTQIGQFPALARMIMRGDVKQSEVIGTRVVSPQHLREGKFNFTETVVQNGDIKSFTGTTPEATLAAGRVVVQFIEKDAPEVKSTFPDMTRYTQGKTIASATKQLLWDYTAQGFFTINSLGTKAVVGFAKDRKQELGNCTITVHSPYAALFLTSLEKGIDLTRAKSALVTVVARNCNSGFKYLTIDYRVIDNGHGPMLLEPVQADITPGREVAAVNILDQDGKRTGKTLTVERNAFHIDTALEKTLYYEIVFK